MYEEKCRIKDVMITPDGKCALTIILPYSFLKKCEKYKDKDLSLRLCKYRKKRSLNANAYLWELCTKIANETNKDGMHATKEEIYIHYIKCVGVFKDFCNLTKSDAKTLSTAWKKLGIGWPTECVDYMPDREHLILRCYYGSSTYNTKQMSRLIEYILQDCKALNISVDDERIRSLLKGDRENVDM